MAEADPGQLDMQKVKFLGTQRMRGDAALAPWENSFSGKRVESMPSEQWAWQDGQSCSPSARRTLSRES